ncbi:MAG TPA: DUF308 domain-containing protein [Acidimicrobiales bacterium]|nr:DUF308 domain-containing protein [Acidimicrobiales bacterium]
MLSGERMITRQAARYWWVFLVTGIGWLLVAWLVLRLNETSLRTVGVLLGVVFILAGVNETAITAVVSGGWRLWHLIMSVIFLLGGLWSFIRPVDSFFALASVLGFVLIFYGSFEISRAIASRNMNPYWWIGLITGVLLILLAFWVSGSDRVFALARRSYLILFWIGFMALFRGFSQLMLAFGVRHYSRTEEAP